MKTHRGLLTLAAALVAVAMSGWALTRLESDFLPPFNEGAVQINVFMPPGTSLVESNKVAGRVQRQLQENPNRNHHYISQ